MGVQAIYTCDYCGKAVAPDDVVQVTVASTAKSVSGATKIFHSVCFTGKIAAGIAATSP